MDNFFGINHMILFLTIRSNCAIMQTLSSVKFFLNCVSFFLQCINQVDGWPWVKYFHEIKPGQWTMRDTTYTILTDDVCGVLKPPEVAQKGRRFFFVFQGKYVGNFHEIE